jgi:hypothetical protein
LSSPLRWIVIAVTSRVLKTSESECDVVVGLSVGVGRGCPQVQGQVRRLVVGCPRSESESKSESVSKSEVRGPKSEFEVQVRPRSTFEVQVRPRSTFEVQVRPRSTSEVQVRRGPSPCPSPSLVRGPSLSIRPSVGWLSACPCPRVTLPRARVHQIWNYKNSGKIVSLISYPPTTEHYPPANTLTLVLPLTSVVISTFR